MGISCNSTLIAGFHDDKRRQTLLKLGFMILDVISIYSIPNINEICHIMRSKNMISSINKILNGPWNFVMFLGTLNVPEKE